MDFDLEPGDSCTESGCAGHYDVGEPENCSCHLAAPCSACENAGLVCDTCGHDTGAAFKEERREALSERTQRPAPDSRRSSTTFTKTANPYNSTPFSACCEVASLGERCANCGALITHHTDPELQRRRREVGPGNCLMCGKKRGPLGVPGNCCC